MWKEYSISYIKNNKATSISIMVAALISSVFISLICGVFYNMWTDNVRRIILEEGDWQGKLIGSISGEDVKTIESYSNVRKVVLSENDTGEGIVAYVYLDYPRSIYEDLPQIARHIGMNIGKDSSSIQYHNTLLSEYFIFSPEEKKNPPMLLSFYIFIMLIACSSLILIIRNAFGVSMNARLHQLGILESVGATPKQIRSVLIQEAFALCLLPIIIGIAAGIGLCYGFMQFANSIAGSIREVDAIFNYNLLVFLVTLIASLLTVWMSACIPAVKLSRLTPLEATRGGTDQHVNKVKRFRILSALFGIEGELARKSIYVRKKAFRTSTLSLTLSFLAFSIFMNFMVLSDISTQHTYFNRYKDTWDLMITIKNAGNHEEELLSDIRNISGVSNCIAYQKAAAFTYLTEDMQSSELKSIGGLEGLKDTGIAKEEGRYWVKVLFIILDDESFEKYCSSAGVDSSVFTGPGTITVNTIWDNINSNRMNRKLIPYIKTEGNQTLKLFSDSEHIEAQDVIPIKIGAYTNKAPDLREEFDNFSLLQIMSTSSYREIAERLSTSEIYFNILAASDNEIADIENNVSKLLNGKYEYTLENRKEEEDFNAAARNGYMLLLWGLCGLLACIGFANVFSNTLGHIHQRRREFARYISVGLTPDGVKKVLFMEALIIGMRPILISLLLNVPFVIFALNASLIPPMEFINRMPVIPDIIFAALILASVGLAYYVGGRKICKYNIVEALKDDTMF